MHKHKAKRESTEITMGLTKGFSMLVLGCFFLSGLTSLVYEILWIRMIGRITGNTPFTVSIILTVFMSGLGLGSFFAGKTIDTVKEPARLLRLYALLELAIGGYGIVLPFLIILSKPFYSLLYNQLFNHFMLYNLLSLTGCIILLILPVICMGATLPVLCRFYVFQLGHIGTRSGRLYSLNTIGAAMGALLCSFWLINLWGVKGTLFFAILLNIIIGTLCLFASYKVKTWPEKMGHFHQDSIGLSTTQDNPSKSSPCYSTGDMRGALIIFSISGFCAMAYEVIWTKLLGLIIGPTTYSFTIVLVTFIIGLGLGSLIFGWLADKVKNPQWLLVFTQIGAGFLALGISQLLGNSQFFFAKLIYHFKDQFAQLEALKAGTLFALMLAPTLCLGATFPIVGKIYTQSLKKIGKSIGFAYAINTFGAVLGSFCAGFLLIPWLGKEQSLSLVVGIQLFSSLVIAGHLLRKNKVPLIRWVPLCLTALFALILCLQIPCWDRKFLSVGKYHRFKAIGLDLETSGWLESLWVGQKIMTKYNKNSELLYYGDGIGGFTTVLKKIDALGTSHYSLANSGKGDASSRGDMNTQTLLAHFPLIFHPNPKNIMVLGLASGITAGEVLHYPIERLDIIEIGEQVVSASNFFTPWNNNVLSNPKTELIIQDAKAHLELTDRTYDVIISEPSNPWMEGLSSLFTRDFFLLAHKRLNEDGIFVQFFHSYQIDWQNFALVIRTFSQVFQNSILVTTSPDTAAKGDYLIVGFKGQNRLVLHNAERNISFAQQSNNITIPNPGVLYRLVVSEDLQKLCGHGPVHSDNWPFLEFAAPKLMYTDDTTITKNISSRRWLSQETKKILYEMENVENQIAFAAFALSIYRPFYNMVDLAKATSDQKKRFFEMIKNYCTFSLIDDCSIFIDPELIETCLSTQIETINNNIHLVPYKVFSYNKLGELYQAKGDIKKAIKCFQKAIEIDPNIAELHHIIGKAYTKTGMIDEAITEYKKALDIKHNLPATNFYLGFAYYRKGNMGKAIAQFKHAIDSDPLNASAHYNLGVIYSKTEMTDKAIAEYKKVLTLSPNHAKAHFNLSIAYYNKRKYKLALIHCDKAINIGYPANPKFIEKLNHYR